MLTVDGVCPCDVEGEGLVTHGDDIVLGQGVLDCGMLDQGVLDQGVVDQGGREEVVESGILPQVLQHSSVLFGSEQSVIEHCQSLSPHSQPVSGNDGNSNKEPLHGGVPGSRLPSKIAPWLLAP